MYRTRAHFTLKPVVGQRWLYILLLCLPRLIPVLLWPSDELSLNRSAHSSMSQQTLETYFSVANLKSVKFIKTKTVTKEELFQSGHGEGHLKWSPGVVKFCPMPAALFIYAVL